MRRVVAQPLTAEDFSPFGDVVSADLRSGIAMNQGTAVRIDHAAALQHDRPDAQPNLVVARCVAQKMPLQIKLLEQHPHSTQCFLPMQCTRFLVCVAPKLADGTPDLAGLKAFICLPAQGVNYHAGVWHHPIAALDGPADFAMLVWENGTAADCVESWFAQAVEVTE